MRVIKYEHACLVLEEEGKRLIIDPGGFTPDFGEVDNVVAVVVTHVHADHFDANHLQTILDANPDVEFFTTREVAEQWQKENVHTPHSGERGQAGPFKLQFSGGLHAKIHDAFPRQQNIGVLVNNLFYYPGDSFTLPSVPAKVLALPVSAPWMKLGEAIDFVKAAKPELCFPTHDALLSERGHESVNNWLKQVCEPAKISFYALEARQAVEF